MKLGVRLGKGSYGSVYGISHNGGKLALKKNLVDLSLDFYGSLREMDILERVRSFPFVVSCSALEEIAVQREGNYRSDKWAFLFPRYTCDLHILIYRKGLERISRETILIQLLFALSLLHEQNILHRDIKPSNILWNGKEAHFCDFGLAKIICKQSANTPRVSNPNYSSPQMGNSRESYGKGSDVWALACVIFELYTAQVFAWSGPINRVTIRKRLASFPEILARPWLHEVLLAMFKMKEEKRITAAQVLSQVEQIFPYFSPLPHPLSFVRSYDSSIDYRDSWERKVANSLIKDIYTNMTLSSLPSASLYSWRILFLAHSLFSRYLEHLALLMGSPLSLEKGFHSEEGTLLRFFSCLYISLKYFLTLQRVPPFQSYVPKAYSYLFSRYLAEELFETLEKFEAYLLFKVVKKEVYLLTPYEAADLYDVLLTPEESSSLLEYSCKIKGRFSSAEIFSAWRFS